MHIWNQHFIVSAKRDWKNKKTAIVAFTTALLYSYDCAKWQKSERERGRERERIGEKAEMCGQL